MKDSGERQINGEHITKMGTLKGKLYISPLKHLIGMEIDLSHSIPYLDGIEYGIGRRHDLTNEEKYDYYQIIAKRRQVIKDYNDKKTRK